MLLNKLYFVIFIRKSKLNNNFEYICIKTLGNLEYP